MNDKPNSPGSGRALVPFVPAARAARPQLTLQSALWAGGLTLAFGVGALGVHAAQNAWSKPDRASLQAEANAQMLRQLEGEIGRLKGSVDTLRASADGARQDDSLRTLKHSVETLKADIDQVRTADGATLAQIATKIDKVDHDPNPKLAEIAARLDRIEHEPAAKAADPQAPKVADLSSRLDRIERQVAAPATTGSIPATATPSAAHAAAVAPPALHTATVAAAAVTSVPRSPPTARPDAADPKAAAAKPATVDAWVVRDVYDGMALVEARRGGLREVEPGEFLPGAGQVRSIERRGREWVVLTSRGVIEPSTF